MSFKRILIPTDGSEFTKNAIEKGIEIAKMCDGSIMAVYVLDQSVYANMPMDSTVVDLYDTLETEGNSAVEYVENRCEEEGIKVETEIVEGIPAKAIVTMSEKYDLVVMGTLGKKGMTKILLGSVAEKVIEKAKCPVMVISASVRSSD